MNILNWILGCISSFGKPKDKRINNDVSLDESKKLSLSINIDLPRNGNSVETQFTTSKACNREYLNEEEVNCKRVKRIHTPNGVRKYSYKVVLEVDNQNYELYTNMTSTEYTTFWKDRLASKSYPHIPINDEVALPVGIYDNEYAYSEKTRDWIGLSLAAKRRGYKFFLVPKDAFLDCVKTKKEYKEREVLLNKTVELNNRGIQEEKEGLIDNAIATYEECMSLGYPARHSYDRLIVLYNKAQKYDDEIRVIKLWLDKFGSDEKLEIRLQKLEGTYIAPDANMPTNRIRFKVSEEPIGLIYEAAKLKFAEFDFYSNGISNSDFLVNPAKDEIWGASKYFKDKFAQAEHLERNNNYKEAAIIYEELIANRYYLASAHDRLIVIYSKAKLKDAEKEVLQEGIKYFSQLRESQQQYVLNLAKKYGKLDFAEERISKRQKITYYDGAFELYNPYTIIDRWKKRLLNLSE